MFCPSCGNPCDDNQAVCNKCGYSFFPQSVPQQKVPRQKKKSGNGIAIALIAASVFLVFCGVAVFFIDIL